MAVPLPLDDDDPKDHLRAIARETRRAKAEQHPSGVAAAMSFLAATPLVRLYIEHQRTVNVFSTNLVGPPFPVYVLGGRILDILPIVQVAGNVGLSLCAFSYAGQLFLVVTADAGTVPDQDVLIEGMRLTWSGLWRTNPVRPDPPHSLECGGWGFTSRRDRSGKVGELSRALGIQRYVQSPLAAVGHAVEGTRLTTNRVAQAVSSCRDRSMRRRIIPSTAHGLVDAPAHRS